MSETDINLREITCKLGVLSRPDGSTLLCQGKTAVVAGIYGPTEVKSQKVLIHKATIEAHYRPKAGIPGINDRIYESTIKNICETALVTTLYPRSAVVVVVQELQNCGGLVSCAVNAACLALLNSGIDMKFPIAAVSCALDQNGQLHVDPDQIVTDHAVATFIFVFDNVQKQVLASHTTGSFSLEQYQESLELCRTASEQVFEFYKKTIKDEILKNK